MDEKSAENQSDKLRESSPRYVVDASGEPIAVLLSIDEYEHYLDLLDDEEDSADREIIARLQQAASQGENEGIDFQQYLDKRKEGDAGLSS